MENRFFEKVVIGHNSFFGVDHIDSKKGQQRAAHFSNVENIIDVINWGVDCGARGLMMSTHERATHVTEMLKKDPNLIDSLKVYPLLPYVQKYVTAANEKGLINVVLDAVSGTSVGETFNLIWQGAKGVLRKDIYALISNLMKIELKPFQGLNVPCIFLHDAFTDLALALDFKNIIDFYHDECSKNFGARAAFATKNYPLFVKKFQEWGYTSPLVMPHVNKIGFSVNPSKEGFEEALALGDSHIMAMSTLASGYLKPDEAFSYIGGLGKIESIVVGMSSKTHVHETISTALKYLK